MHSFIYFCTALHEKDVKRDSLLLAVILKNGMSHFDDFGYVTLGSKFAAEIIPGFEQHKPRYVLTLILLTGRDETRKRSEVKKPRINGSTGQVEVDIESDVTF